MIIDTNPNSEPWNYRIRAEIASELSVRLGPETNARANGLVGGEMTKRLVAVGLNQLTRTTDPHPSPWITADSPTSDQRLCINPITCGDPPTSD